MSGRNKYMLVRGPCHWCGGKACTADHYVPTAKGGGNGWFNLVPSCVECNQFKNDMTPEEFLLFCRDILLFRPIKYEHRVPRARMVLRRHAPEMIP